MTQSVNIPYLHLCLYWTIEEENIISIVTAGVMYCIYIHSESSHFHFCIQEQYNDLGRNNALKTDRGVPLNIANCPPQCVCVYRLIASVLVPPHVCMCAESDDCESF